MLMTPYMHLGKGAVAVFVDPEEDLPYWWVGLVGAPERVLLVNRFYILKRRTLSSKS